MKFKLIVVLVEDARANAIVEAARTNGATGATVIPGARGEGLKPVKTFLGLDLVGQRDMILLLVEEHLCRAILERVAEAGQFDEAPGTGIAFQIDIEDAIGLGSQIQTISSEIEGEL